VFVHSVHYSSSQLSTQNCKTD